ncbi:sugar-transfer associated ATP-grasp domain-containing protein [Streptomyces alkaliterrae]|uniref:Alpha-L-glutamate ligase-related protein ATP-grasp domain-containing protein n=1 Tax=Streptomyces alkaliterrae TaxID=2213162 RepID=A0A5P0YQN8_9ACTN|nr:sugar-transfer associated ATP-grasp domain-containing protein [Streptomyces alkaliterrae]MBB1259390.1 hypothetical protein [Streptomyces alkaliterrae]MQS01762.1 hypothetical protein [Streptomyces alkaliterrae]
MRTRRPARNLNVRQAEAEEFFRRTVLPRLMLPGSFAYQVRQLVAEHLPALRESEAGRKPMRRVARELAALGAKWKCLPFHYFRYGLYRDEVSLGEAMGYLPETVLFARLLPAVNRDTVLLDDKVLCKRVLAAGDVPQPRLLASGDVRTATLPDGTSLPLAAVRGALPAHTPAVMKPARYASGGAGIVTVNAYDDESPFCLREYAERWGSWLIEERVRQHPDLAALNPGVVNTFRVITCWSRTEAEALYCMLKLGGVSGLVDNSSTGGMQIRVDIDTGELDPYGYDRWMRRHTHHPSTATPFAGRKVGLIKEVLGLAERAAQLFPQVPFAGWDIALTPEGPTVIEGNSSPSLAHIQRTHSVVAPVLLGRLKDLRGRPLL